MSCSRHPEYKGLRLSKKARQCKTCCEFYEENKNSKIKESRKRRKENLADLIFSNFPKED